MYIGLIAHDDEKTDARTSVSHSRHLSKHELYATGTTGRA